MSKQNIIYGALLNNKFHHEKLWKQALSKNDKLLVHCHSEKYTGTIEAIQIETVKTKWENTLRAQLKLLQQALIYDDTWTHLCLVSESCVPLVKSTEIKKQLKPGITFLNEMIQNRKIMSNKKRNYPNQLANFSHTHEQWYIIAREHAELATEKAEEILKYYKASNHAAEHWLATYLHYQGLGHQIEGRDYLQIEWPSAGSHPKTYDVINQVMRNEWVANGKLIARKAGQTTEIYYNFKNPEKAAVFFHIHYQDIALEMVEQLKELKTKIYLYITHTKDINDTLMQRLQQLGKVKLIKVDNKGADSHGFFKAIKGVRLDQYKYCLKLHTMRDKEFAHLPWRDSLVMQLIEDEVKLSHYDYYANPFFYYPIEPPKKNYHEPKVYQLLDQHGLNKQDFFTAGTIFAFSPRLGKIYQKLTEETVEWETVYKRQGQWAHSFERLYFALGQKCRQFKHNHDPDKNKKIFTNPFTRNEQITTDHRIATKWDGIDAHLYRFVKDMPSDTYLFFYKDRIVKNGKRARQVNLNTNPVDLVIVNGRINRLTIPKQVRIALRQIKPNGNIIINNANNSEVIRALIDNQFEYELLSDQVAKIITKK